MFLLVKICKTVKLSLESVMLSALIFFHVDHANAKKNKGVKCFLCMIISNMWCESDEWATTLEGSNSLQTMKWRHIINDKIGSILIYLNQHSIYLCHPFHRSLLLTQCFPSISIFSTPIWCMQPAICDMYVYINDRITIALTLRWIDVSYRHDMRMIVSYADRIEPPLMYE